jgi:hypothetical protein
MLRESKIVEQMELLGIKDITTIRQTRNGTVIWQLPIKMYGQFIEVGSFKSGYVRRMNGGYTPYQLNKCEPSVTYYKDYETIWNEDRSDYIQKPTGKYNKFVGKSRILIPNEVDRLEYLISYCLKNYYIKQANQVEDGKFVTKWRHEYELEKASKFKYSCGQIENLENGDIFVHEQHAYWNKWQEDKPSSVEIIIDGHRYKVK